MHLKIHNIPLTCLSPPKDLPRMKDIIKTKYIIITFMNDTHNEFSKLEIPVIVKLVVMYEAVHKLIFKFPKHERYSLGEKIENTILEAIEILTLASQISKFEKEKMLLRANSKNEILKILFRITLNCGIIECRQYLEIESKLQEIGKMTQGWIKYARNMK